MDYVSPAMEDLQMSPLLAHRGSFYPIRFVLFLFLGLLSIAILLPLIVFIRGFQLEAPAVHVTSISISSFNLTRNSPEIKGQLDAILSLQNLNRLNRDADVKYEARAWLYYKNQFISTTRITRSHHSSEGQEILMHASFEMDTKRIDAADYGSEICSEFQENFTRRRAVLFDLLLEANLTVNTESWLEKRTFLMVDCDDLKIEFSLNRTLGTLSGGVKACQAQILARKY